MDVYSLLDIVDIQFLTVARKLIQINVVVGRGQLHHAVLAFALYQFHSTYTAQFHLFKRSKMILLGNDVFTGFNCFRVPVA